MRVRQAVVVLSLLALSGCAVNSQTQVPDRSVIVQSMLATNFSLSGRFSAKNGSEQVSGQFRYAQLGESRTLNLFSPLGTPLADIVADRTAATLTQANGATQSAASLSALLRTVIDLPVTDATLSAWLQGQPSASAAPAVWVASGTERDASGLPSRFVESGWEIVISARMEGADAPTSTTTATVTTAPKRMRWSLMGQPDTEVRWVIDEWRAP